MHPEPHANVPASTSLRVVSLFSGAGGLDLGLERAGHKVVQLCENWAPAQRVLRARFPGVPLSDDVRTLHVDQPYDLLAAGFPCVDLSHAGRQQGIFGPQSGLVQEVFRIAAETRPRFVLVENVTNLLRLGGGTGIAHVVDSLTALGYSWAYRVVDSRTTGVPQRRRRVFLLASLDGSAGRLLQDEAANLRGDRSPDEFPRTPSGFYWTEGRRGVGLVRGAIPTLKGGSTLGLPSAPAIWDPSADAGRRIVLPTIEHAETLQGFPTGWTEPAAVGGEPDRRWKLVGNAVTVGVGEWLGAVLGSPTGSEAPLKAPEVLDRSRPWPDAAFGADGEEFRTAASDHPRGTPLKTLSSVIADGGARPLSRRATAGFLSRVNESGIKLDAGFIRDLEEHRTYMEQAESWSSSPAVRARMQRVPKAGTVPEQLVRKALTARGARYRLQVRLLDDERFVSDIVFAGAKVVVDVRGCYWHACPVHSTMPKQNASQWSSKFERNRDRDERMVRALTERGWHVETVWEHEDADDAARRVLAVVEARRPARAPR